MPPCHIKPEDKKAFISAVGQQLVKTQGKRKYYKPDDIGRAAHQCGYSADIHCWAQCFFATPEAFEALHRATGETCDYVAMKAELLSDLATNGSFALPDLDLSWLEWPDIDLSAIFEWFDFS